MKSTREILEAARRAKTALAEVSEERINRALLEIADELCHDAESILAQNALDLERSQGVLSPAMIDRLMLNRQRIEAMAEGIRAIAALPCPLGKTLSETKRPNGLTITKVCVPMGVVAIIYESRPNVTSDAAALALKSGNACILRGGKEAYLSSRAIVESIRRALVKAGLPQDAVELLYDTTREGATELMRARGYVDLLIPRGGAGLIRATVENATVPCIETGTGICHIYLHEDADEEKAVSIIENAKCSRPSVCNALEVLLVNEGAAKRLLPRIYEALVSKRKERGLCPVEIRADDEARKYIDARAATAEDFDTEFLDYVLAVKTVNSLNEATEHIALHSTHHSEAIITESEEAAEKFIRAVDSAAVYVNASTRFTDGAEFGLGCEMGISTQKLHARGPMGIEELTSYKYIVLGNGQTR